MMKIIPYRYKSNISIGRQTEPVLNRPGEIVSRSNNLHKQCRPKLWPLKNKK